MGERWDTRLSVVNRMGEDNEFRVWVEPGEDVWTIFAQTRGNPVECYGDMNADLNDEGAVIGYLETIAADEQAAWEDAQ